MHKFLHYETFSIPFGSYPPEVGEGNDSASSDADERVLGLV